jgi:hypothetical protein
MGQALGLGLLSTLRRWPVVLLLFSANLAAGLCFTGAAWSWLSASLDNSLATRTLLTDLDWNVFVDLVAHHGDSLQMLLATGVALALPALLLGVWLNAVAVVAVGEDGSLGDCLRRGLTIWPRFLRLSLLSTFLSTAGTGAAILMGRWVTRWTAESTSDITFYGIVGTAAVLTGGLLVFLVTVHDHARVRSTARGTGAVSAYTWALLFVTRREWRALPLAIFLLCTSFVLWVVYQTVGMLVTTTSTHGIVLSLAWGEALLLARMLLRVWSFAAATELQGLGQ